ncbi:MAG: SDR family oxidoreductase [Deinococcota bacterium]
MARLDGKVAIVTGGASGLGHAIALRFAEEGAKVVIADLSDEAGHKIAADIGGHFIKTDVTDASAVEALVKETVSNFGKLDIIVNNAGIDGEQAPTASSSLDNWHKVIDVNLHGVYYGMKYAIEAMLEAGNGGSVINMGSTAGLVGFKNIPPYVASKAAVVNMARSAAQEYGPDHIRVNSICPTVVKTPLVEHFINSSADPEAQRKAFDSFNPLPGMAEPRDVANAALFLASDESRFVSGIALPVDGAYTAA